MEQHPDVAMPNLNNASVTMFNSRVLNISNIILHVKMSQCWSRAIKVISTLRTCHLSQGYSCFPVQGLIKGLDMRGITVEYGHFSP